ncbi:MAG: hypothetical protein IJC59_04060 [Lachnospiraceae bacterium]|nr:hypothetical protein [Lachnospiraceae bacterium]
MEAFEKEFDFILDRAKSVKKPARVVIAGADAENILQAAFAAQSDGFVYPVLVGNEAKITEMLKNFGLADREYQLCAVDEGENVVQHAIDIINVGMGDVLMRGNTSTRDFLMTILNKANKLIKNEVICEVAMLKVPHYPKVLTMSDVSVMIQPSVEKRKLIIKNMVEILNKLGVERPSVAVLALVEKPSFHMRDTVEAQTIARDHAAYPIANCDVVGPIPWDLIVSKEAARLKGYDCPYCGEFDAVLMPDVMSGNSLMKALTVSAHGNSCGIIGGASIPIAITSRSSSMEHSYLSLAASVALLKKK